MDEDKKAFNVSKSLIFVQAGLRQSSLDEHKYYMSQRENHAIQYYEAIIDWSRKHHNDWFNETFSKNKQYIMNYVAQHEGEIRIEQGQLKFTREQFEHLMLQDHSAYSPKPKQSLEETLRAA